MTASEICGELMDAALQVAALSSLKMSNHTLH